MIISAYEYLFYKLYIWSIKVNGEDYYNKASACFMVSAVLLLNAITFVAIFAIITGVFIIPSNLPKVFGALAAVLVWLFNYIYFSSGKRYLKILDRYRNESEGNAKRGNIIVTSYVIGSFVLLVISGYLGIYVNQFR